MTLIHRRTQRLTTLLAFVLCACAPGVAQERGVEVRLVSPKLQDASPGHILSLSFLVTSHTEQDEEFIENLRLPEGWRAVIPAASFRLRPAEATTRLVAFQVAQDAPAGRYEVAYGVRSQRDPAIQHADTVTIAVLAVTKLSLLIEEQPERVIAGDSFEAKLRLVNQGNAELQVRIDAHSQENYPAKIDATEVTVAAGKSALLRLTVQTYAQENRRRTLVVGVQARASVKESVATASATVAVEIIPRVSGKLDMYHRLPMRATLRLAGRDGGLRPQMEIEGRGTVDEEGMRHVDFAVRTPTVRDAGPFSEVDLYRLGYSTPSFALRAGDMSYSLSRLTSSWSYGRGLALDFPSSDRTLASGVYYLDERWGKPDRQEGGLYLAQRINDTVWARLNFLRQERDASNTQPGIHDTVWSMETRLTPRDDTSLEMEYANSDSSRAGGLDGDAYRVALDGRFRRNSYYNFYVIHASPNYYGAYTDSQYVYGTVSIPIAEATQASISYRTYERNLHLLADRSSAPREEQWSVGFDHRLAQGWYTFVGYDRFARRDALPPSEYDYDEQALGVGLGRSTRDYSLRFNMRAADQRDRLRTTSRTGYNYELFATYRPRQENFFSLHVGCGDNDALRGSYLLRESSSLTLLTSWQPRPDLNLDFWYTKYGFNSSDRPESDQYSFRLRQRLPNSHEIALQARHNTRELWESETSYELAYTIPLGLAVSRKKTVGSVRGRVYDAQLAERPGIAGAILRINAATAVTNQAGEFVFPSAAPGTYQIYLDRASIGLDRVTEQKLPLTVEVVAGETTEVEIGVVRAAAVKGTVLLIPANDNNGNGNGNRNGHGNGNGNGAFVIGQPGNNNNGNGNGNRNGHGNGNGNGASVIGQPGNNNATHGPTVLPNILVELANGQEVLRRVTDHKGQFVFESLRPGSWRLKVYDHNLPAYHYLETSEQDLTLEPGQSIEITLRVLPKARQIRFIDEGVIRPNGTNQ